MFALEEYVDKNGMHTTLLTLAAIAREKADHLRSNWQDEGTARVWDSFADATVKFADTKARNATLDP